MFPYKGGMSHYKTCAETVLCIDIMLHFQYQMSHHKYLHDFHNQLDLKILFYMHHIEIFYLWLIFQH